ncbi:MAG TPA: hypothetical protein VGF44_17820 [Terriglobales bacterium]
MKADFNAGLQALAGKQYENASELLQKASALGQNQPAIWGALAEADTGLAATKPESEQRPLLLKAVEAYQHAVSLKPNEPAYLNNYALALGKTGRLDEAQKVTNQVISLDPAKAAVYSQNLGIMFHNAGRNRETIEILKSVPASAPQYKSAQWLISVSTVAVYLDSAKAKFSNLRGKQEATDADVRKTGAEINQPVGDIGHFTVWDSTLTIPGGDCNVFQKSGDPAELQCAFDQAATVSELKPSYDTLISMVGDAVKPNGSEWTSTEGAQSSDGLKHTFTGPQAEVHVSIYNRSYASSSMNMLKYRVSLDIIAPQ